VICPWKIPHIQEVVLMLKEPDACTKFLHIWANSRAMKTFIPCLRTGNGDYVWSHEGKEQILSEYFKNVIGTTMGRQATRNLSELNFNLSQLPKHHHLDDHFTEAEIKRARMELPT
jgi:hypothetical protein